MARDDRTGRLFCDPTPRQPRIRGRADPGDVNAYVDGEAPAPTGKAEAMPDSIKRFAYHSRSGWATLDDFAFARPLGQQTSVIEGFGARLEALRARLAGGGTTCFVYRDAPRGTCGSALNCPFSGNALDGSADLADEAAARAEMSRR